MSVVSVATATDIATEVYTLPANNENPEFSTEYQAVVMRDATPIAIRSSGL